MKTSLPISGCRGPLGAPARTGRARTPCAPQAPDDSQTAWVLATGGGAQRSARPTFKSAGRAGFTLVEILATIALLTFIILGLYTTFTQVQRAFRMSMSQVDKLEAGRAVTGMLPRDFEQVIAAGREDTVNFETRVIANSTPLTQPLPGSSFQRTNLLQDCFVLLRDNQTWVGIGFCVRTSDANGRLQLPECGPGQLGVGSLYRFYETNAVVRPDGLTSDPGQLYQRFLDACVPGSPASLAISNRICDGVIHFHFRAFATNGYPIVYDSRYGTNGVCFRSDDGLTAFVTNSVVKQASGLPNYAYPDNLAVCRFWGNAVPASLEMELGILDQHTQERYSSIPAPAARLAYLQRTEISGLVQIFRQRIPVRNVDPSAYQ